MSKKTEKLKDLSSASFNEIISITRNYKQNPMELLKKYEKHFHNQYDKVMKNCQKLMDIDHHWKHLHHHQNLI